MSALALSRADLREFDGEARVQDLRLAEVLGFDQPLNIRRLIRSNRARLEQHGPVFSAAEKTTSVRGRKGEGRPGTTYYLNEKQAYRLCMFSDAPFADRVQAQMVEVFFAWRRDRLPYPAQKKPRRTGRGHLCSIDRLPACCAEDVAWAKARLTERDMQAVEVLRAFNARIMAKGQKAVSKSAWGRYSVRHSLEMQRAEEALIRNREIVALLGPQGNAEGLLATASILRERLAHVLTHDTNPTPRSVAYAAHTLERLTAVEMHIGQSRRTGKAVAA